MQELTAYFITTGRVHANEALESLNAQGFRRPIVTIRNVRPLAAAHLPTLECETPYCLVLDDDTVLRPGVVQTLLDRFREKRSADPSGFKFNAMIYCRATSGWDFGGLKLFYTPHLIQVGWPDAPHVAIAQARKAKRMGFTVMNSDIKAGVQRPGTGLDVYKKYLWLEIRARAGQLQKVSLARVARKAWDGQHWLWFAVLGLADARAVGDISTSKDEDFRGPIGRTIDFRQVDGEDIRRILADRGLIAAQPESGRQPPGPGATSPRP